MVSVRYLLRHNMEVLDVGADITVEVEDLPKNNLWLVTFS